MDKHAKTPTSELLSYLYGWVRPDGTIEEKTEQGVKDRLAELDERLPPRAYEGDVDKEVSEVPKEKKVFVNGEQFDLPLDEISYEQLCDIADVNPLHYPTAVYSRGVHNSSGSMHVEQSVSICDGMIFTVVHTGNA